ncbi:alpha/beta hydrolase family protein [Longimicrobium sp.]|uniref:alpha/beta hydrolase family protein n=1 Tax=Longimicrobium sp. TaxID=2029185 RepID=UPI003B3BA69E
MSSDANDAAESIGIEPGPADAIAAGTFAYDPAAPLELGHSLESVRNGVETHAISFASPKGGRVTGLLHVPRSEGRKAGIVNMHGAPGSARRVAASSVALARRGAVVVSIDAPFTRRGGEMATFTEADRAEHVQLVIDLQRAVDLLLARPDVDPARIAYVGVSYGGAVGAMYAAVDSRPAAYVLVVPDGGMVSHHTGVDGSFRGPLRRMPPDVRDRWLAAMRPVEGIGYVDRVTPGSILFQNGRHDPTVPADKAALLHRAAGPSHTVLWYESRHGLPPQARIDRWQFLAERIGTAPPTDAERAAAANPPPPRPPRIRPPRRV